MNERRLAQEQLGAALEYSPDAVVIVDEQGTIVLVNEQTEVLFGYPRSELLGQPVERLVPDRLTAAHLQHRDGYVAAPRVRPMGVGLELTGKRSDGSEFPVHISLGPLDLDERPLVIATVREISERLQAQAAARQLDDLRRRRHEALELNDSVVQQLAVARLALDLGQEERAARVIEQALTAAQTIVAELLSEQLGDRAIGVQPGDLVRAAAAAAEPGDT
jgi:PAS domain S-box-containing protein